MTRVVARRVVTPTGILEPGWVEVDGAQISQVAPGVPGPSEPLTAATIVPGLVDVHVHGGGGASFAAGTDREVLAALAHHRRLGTTTVCASLMTAPLPALHAQVSHLAGLVESGQLAGVHLEGPWLSPRRAGAHSPHLLRQPERSEVLRLLAAGRDTVRMVTLAPELDGGLDAVRTVVELGVVVALGHTDATYVTAHAALDAGATHGTHLGNGMRPLHHREPGVALALLEREGVVVELINDGVHLHDSVTSAVVRAVGPQRVALVSDAISASGLSDGTHRLGHDEVRVLGREARQVGSGSLAGSVVSLAECLRRAVVELGVSLGDAVAMASTIPAKALRLPGVGRIEAGAVADLVALDDDLHVVAVMHHGRWVETGVETRSPPEALTPR